MRTVSPAETARQIRREGAHLGLVPLFDDGKCFVAERTRELHNVGFVDVVVESAEKLCSITMQHPITNIYKSRKARGEHDNVKWYREHRLRREQKAKQEAAEQSKDRVRELLKAQRQVGRVESLEAFYEGLERLAAQRAG